LEHSPLKLRRLCIKRKEVAIMLIEIPRWAGIRDDVRQQFLPLAGPAPDCAHVDTVLFGSAQPYDEDCVGMGYPVPNESSYRQAWLKCFIDPKA
jgi:hypothetical protein